MITPIFLATLIAVFETAIFLFAQQNLQNAAMQAGRLLMTGQVQNGGMTQSDFNKAICPMIQSLFNCSQLIVDVQSYPSFSGANAGKPTPADIANNTWAYNPGTPGQVVVVRLIYKWSVVNGPLGFTLANLPNNAAEMMGVSAFRVEPFL
jgi:Flp pilus assembly protein TadG